MSENTYFRNHLYKRDSLVKPAVLILIQNFTLYIAEYLSNQPLLIPQPDRNLTKTNWFDYVKYHVIVISSV